MPKVNLTNLSQVNTLVEKLKNLRSERQTIFESSDNEFDIHVEQPGTHYEICTTGLSKDVLLKAIDTEIARAVKELKKLRINPDA